MATVSVEFIGPDGKIAATAMRDGENGAGPKASVRHSRPIRILPVGTCRIHTPLRIGSKGLPIQPVLNRNYGFVHTSREVLRQLRWILGEDSVPEQVRPYVFRSTGNERNIFGKVPEFDLVVAEISSAKDVTVAGEPIQVNYLQRRFPAIFSSEVASRIWKHVQAGDADGLAALLDTLPAYRALSHADREALVSLSTTNLGPQEVTDDLAEIVRLVGCERLVVVTHVNAILPDGQEIASRAALIRTVKNACRRLGVECYDPTPVMQRVGQVAAMESDGLDTTHYTPGFAAQLVADLYRSAIRPLAERCGIPIADDPGEGFDAMPAVAPMFDMSAMDLASFAAGMKDLMARYRSGSIDATSRSRLASMLLRLGLHEMVIEALGSVLAEPDQSEEDRLLLFEAFFEVGRFEEAIAVGQSLLSDEYENPGMLRRMATACERIGRMSDALAYWQHIQASSPSSREATAAILRLLPDGAERREQALQAMARQGFNEDALIALLEVAIRSPTSIPGLVPAGFESDEAILPVLSEHEVVRILASYPNLEPSRRKAVGRMLIDHGIWLPGARELASAGDTSCRSSAVDALVGLLQRMTAEGKSVDALAVCHAVLMLDPACREARAVRLDLRNRVGSMLSVAQASHDDRMVVAILGRLVHAGMDSGRHHLMLANAASRLGLERFALHHFQASLDREGSQPKVLFLMARLATKAGEYVLALEKWADLIDSDEEWRARAVDAVASHQSKFVRRVRDLVASGAYDEAHQLLRKMEAASISSDIVAKEMQRLESCIRSDITHGNRLAPEARLAKCRALLRINPSSEVGLRAAAVTCMRDRRFREAASYWRRLEAISGDGRYAAQIQRCEEWVRRLEGRAAA